MNTWSEMTIAILGIYIIPWKILAADGTKVFLTKALESNTGMLKINHDVFHVTTCQDLQDFANTFINFMKAFSESQRLNDMSTS